VKCGYCGQQFNAIERLHDEPLVEKNTEVPQLTEEQTAEAEPQFDISNAADKYLEEHGSEASDNRSDAELEDSQGVNDISVPSDESSKNLDSQILSEKSISDQRDKLTTELEEDYGPQKTSGAQTSYSFSEKLLDEPIPKSGIGRRLLWLFGSSLLILVILTQVAWFNRDELLDRYPDLIPWVNKLCTQIKCEPIRRRDLSAIKLINRDVRDHPRYEQALLVNATMSNQSHTAQPFPVVRLTLFNTSSVSIDYCNFTPDVYLDDGINVLKGMLSDVPVHFVLEVTGATEEAVSFKFDFL